MLPCQNEPVSSILIKMLYDLKKIFLTSEQEGTTIIAKGEIRSFESVAQLVPL